MWFKVAQVIIRYRLILFILIAGITLFMGYHALKIETGYDFRGTVPSNDSVRIELNRFKEQFGEDGNIIAVGLKDSAIFQYQNFEKLREFCLELKKINGVNDLISLPRIKMIEKDTAEKRFFLRDIFPSTIQSQPELDSLLTEAKKQKFYIGQIVNEENGAISIFISVQKEVLNSAKRLTLTNEVVALGEQLKKTPRLNYTMRAFPLYGRLLFNRLVGN